MTFADPEEIRETLELSLEDIWRTGKSLYEYAEKHEPYLQNGSADEFLARADCLAHAASLLALVEPEDAIRAFAYAGTAYQAAGEPYAAVCWLVAASRQLFDWPYFERETRDPVADAIVSAWASLRREDGITVRFVHREPGFSATGIPHLLLYDIALAAGERDEARLYKLMSTAIERSDEVIALAMADRWHWSSLSAGISPAEPELLALGALAHAADTEGGVVNELADTPAGIAVKAGARLQAIGWRD